MACTVISIEKPAARRHPSTASWTVRLERPVARAALHLAHRPRMAEEGVPGRDGAPVLARLVVAASSMQPGNPRAESLAQAGPARAALDRLEDSGIGTGPLSPFDALVRSRGLAPVVATLER